MTNIDSRPIYYHKNPGSMTQEKLDLFLDFVSDTAFVLSSFEVWEAENCHSIEDNEKWNKETSYRFSRLIKLKEELDYEIITKHL